MISKPEILIPGGDFNSALHGLTSGADAVYTGLKSFSARKGAKNLTIEELRRLKTFALENGKKIYIAINTLIEDHEFPEAIKLLQELERIEIDAVIIQDLGLAKIIKENFNLEIHASTQLSVHKIHGIRALKKLGFTRAVLSRELNLEEISYIKKNEPEMELEVFIHGALCYGFSGLCLASGKLLNRSANRGECGQICRTWFNNRDRKEYSFSLNDLHLGDNIIKLKELGVESLKIEGRMKGPSYTSKIAKYYRSILEGNSVFQDSPLVEFNRSGGTGYLFSRNGGTSINKDYPGHTGLPIGSLTSVKRNSFTIKTQEKLWNRDGLMLLPDSVDRKPFKIGVKILSKEDNKYTLSGTVPKGYKKNVYKISNHDSSLKEFKPESFKIFKTEITVIVVIERDRIEISSKIYSFSYDIKIEEARNESRYLDEINRILSPGGSSYFSFKIKEVKTEVKNPFIPSSILKKIRNEFIESITQAIQERDRKSRDNILDFNYSIEERSYLPTKGEVPFFPYSKSGNRLSLMPVVFDSNSYLDSVIKEVNSRDSRTIIGLNNLGQTEFINSLPDSDYYCDYGLYATNRWAKALLASIIPNLKWVTRWVEKDNLPLSPPIFISRTCFHKTEKGCPKDCKKNYNYTISQNNREYRIFIRDCITYTFV